MQTNMSLRGLIICPEAIRGCNSSNKANGEGGSGRGVGVGEKPEMGCATSAENRRERMSRKEGGPTD